MENIYQGAKLDTRTEEEKLKDYKFEEIVSSIAPVNWKEKKQNDWRKFPIFDQDGSGSCVAQTMAKLLGIMYWLANGIYVHFSATHIYQRRFNKPEGGMNGDDVFKIASEGVTLEELVPSQNMSDSEMDAVVIPEYKKKVGEIFKISKNWITIPIKDIETVASVIQQTGKGVMLWFYFRHDEWDKDPSVKYNDLVLGAPTTARHSVTGVDFTLYNTQKAIVIDDSWGPKAGNGAGQRVIDEAFFNARNWYARYPMNFQFAEGAEPNKPIYTFANDMKFSATVTYGNPDIIALQNCLKYLGLFPVNTESTGYFGALTKKAVQDFQKKYGLNPDGVVGKITRSKLNELFSK
jgi:hypothetical protein